MLKGAQIYIIAALVLAIVAAVGVAYKRGQDAQLNKIALANANATIAQLKQDAAAVKKLQTQNRILTERVKHANTIFSQVKDPTGCFTTPVPRTASDELFKEYQAISAGAEPGLIQEGALYLPSETGDGQELHGSPGAAVGSDKAPQ